MDTNFALPLNRYFDHTLLKAEATEEQIDELLRQAAEYDFAAVCVNGRFVRRAAEALAETDVSTATVVGFPLGAMASAAKAEEARIAIADGADEIDMVIPIGAAKAGRWDQVEEEIALLARVCHEAEGKAGPVLLKVILETCLLDDEEIILACQTCRVAGADFVKTSTGFSTGGATAAALSLMKKTVGDTMKIKASGGIRTLSDALTMIEAGADRLGCSASVKIMEEYRSR